jgi:hypothetical protein
MDLATRKITSSAADIERALRRETDPYTELKMAGSLFQLVPSQGLPYLTSLCQKSKGGKAVMINAALGLVILDPHGTSASPCVSQLIRFLKDNDDHLNQANALSVLMSYRSKLTATEIDEVRALSIKFVTSPNFGLKAAAVHALMADDSALAREALKQAVNAEPNPDDQKFMKDVIGKGTPESRPSP